MITNTLLSAPEKETYRLLCQNKTNREMAEELGLAQITITKRLQSVYRKLGLCTDDQTQVHTIRRDAIQLGNSNNDIPERFKPKDNSELFSEWDLRRVARELTWYESDIVNAIVTDLILFLKDDQK